MLCPIVVFTARLACCKTLVISYKQPMYKVKDSQVASIVYHIVSALMDSSHHAGCALHTTLSKDLSSPQRLVQAMQLVYLPKHEISVRKLVVKYLTKHLVVIM